MQKYKNELCQKFTVLFHDGSFLRHKIVTLKTIVFNFLISFKYSLFFKYFLKLCYLIFKSLNTYKTLNKMLNETTALRYKRYSTHISFKDR